MNVKSLRLKAQSALEEPPIYRLPRLVSIYFTLALLRTGATPNGITMLWCLLLFVAAFLLAIGERSAEWAALACIALYFILDCVDGEMARARDAGSRLGSQLEQVCHWVSGGVLIAGAGWERIVAGGSAVDVLVFTAALVGNYAFYFVFYQLMLLMTPGHNYGLLHPLAGFVYLLMPLEVNLVVAATIVGEPWAAVVAWAVISNALGGAIFLLYYRNEKVRLREAAADVAPDDPPAPAVQT